MSCDPCTVYHTFSLSLFCPLSRATFTTRFSPPLCCPPSLLPAFQFTVLFYSLPTSISTILRCTPPAICTPVGPARFAPEKSIPLCTQLVFYTPAIYTKKMRFSSPKMASTPPQNGAEKILVSHKVPEISEKGGQTDVKKNEIIDWYKSNKMT